MAFDPFAILGLPRRFDLDPMQVQRAYLARAAMAHPDLLPGGGGGDVGPGSGSSAMDPSALNRAKSVLDDPEQRADALLLLLGGPPREADRSLPDGFLVEIMDIRERLDAAVASRDTAVAAELEAWAAQRRAGHIRAAAELFGALPRPPSADALRAIRRELNAWRYIERMLEQVRDADRM
ncbi:MAG: hypothetical protein KF699_13745 [Phycisphaeraceae bacterium]|nr:hypothetical protein [Phycisphaeraceae bacterium]MBX3407980.1 hypothetical protein [Phycisphaeraceae bacterium]